MKVLLDTHVLLWWFFDSPRLSVTARAIISERSNEMLVSAASAWEIATKHRLGKLPEATVLIGDFEGWLERAVLIELPITVAHANRAGRWSQPHRDPFDRMLAAQSAVENIPLMSADAALKAFGIMLIW